ncbi:unnamed protein product [Prunus armeniaca]
MDFPYNLPLLLGKQIKPLNVVLSLVFIEGVLEGQSRLKRSALWSLIGASGVTPINPGKSRPPP